MDIRPLTPADVDQYLAIWQRALTDAPTAFGASANDPGMFDRDPALQRIAQSLPYNPIFGVFVDGQQVALSSLFYAGHREKIRHRLQIHQVFVNAHMRGRGIARAMLNEVIAFARTIPDAEEIYLAVTVGNESARRLYASAGFETAYFDRRYLKIDGVYYDLEWMWLSLV
ncbi:MAG: GNAT family N-acetyltransferase [Chloroflexi bacterium]|uniref:GNAT family N-acetyltransferase n=1 Tax=Candidatus Flexifilum breve TaxID=3140694 RepID=UPI0031346781|nr:GNAT family N-acetyltransferase [Chloroflexota bacterium]